MEEVGRRALGEWARPRESSPSAHREGVAVTSFRINLQGIVIHIKQLLGDCFKYCSFLLNPAQGQELPPATKILHVMPLVLLEYTLLGHRELVF